jgi:50S ribosomal protein L16 3-hydroxylase
MLYLPPHYAHEGIAIGECMTYSIGFRAPSYQELGEAFLHFMADSIDLPGRYADPDLHISARPAEIGTAMADRIATELSKAQFTKDDILVFLGEYLSEPKPAVFFRVPEKKLNLERFLQQAEKHGVVLSSRSRMLYRGKHIFINGESFVLRRADAKTLVMLADGRSLEGDSVRNASNDVKEALHTWYQAGWLGFRTS